MLEKHSFVKHENSASNKIKLSIKRRLCTFPRHLLLTKCTHLTNGLIACPDNNPNFTLLDI